MLITEGLASFLKKGRKTAVVKEWYPPWLTAGDWLAAGEKFRPQVDRIRYAHISSSAAAATNISSAKRQQ